MTTAQHCYRRRPCRRSARAKKREKVRDKEIKRDKERKEESEEEKREGLWPALAPPNVAACAAAGWPAFLLCQTEHEKRRGRVRMREKERVMTE